MAGDTDRGGAARLISMLEALVSADAMRRRGLTVAEMARALGRDKSVVSRQARSLVDLGVVERDEDGRHGIGWRLFSIVAQAGEKRLLLVTTPVMRKLSQRVHGRSHLIVLLERGVLKVLSESP